MRLFIAISMPDEVCEALSNMQLILQKEGIPGNYVAKENFHMTLAFIGEYPDADDVMEALNEVSFAPFQIDLSSFGVFNNDVLWAGVQDQTSLQALARKIRYVLAKGNIPFDNRSFCPHITLARNTSLDNGIPELQLPEFSFTVDHFSLFRSDRGRNGMIYTELGAIDAVEKAE